jgi:hypothetical protein
VCTFRQRLREALLDEPGTLRELSQRLGATEAEIAEHLDHVRQSAERSGEHWVVVQPRCQSCGFSFEERRRLRKPSRCPRCRSERVTPPRFALEQGAS